MKYKLLFLVLVASYSNTILAGGSERHCFSGLSILGENRDIFRPGTFGERRVAYETHSETESLVFRRLKAEDLLTQHGVENGDTVDSICGVPVSKIFDLSTKDKLCCTDLYPKEITLRVNKSLLETYSVVIERGE